MLLVTKFWGYVLQGIFGDNIFGVYASGCRGQSFGGICTRMLLLTMFWGYRHQGVVDDYIWGDIGIKVLLLTMSRGIWASGCC